MFRVGGCLSGMIISTTEQIRDCMESLPAQETLSRHSCLVKHKQNNVIITSLSSTQEAGDRGTQQTRVLHMMSRTVLLRQQSYDIKNQLVAKIPPTRGISCSSLVLYGIRMVGFMH